MLVIGVFSVPGVEAEVTGNENPVTGVAVGVRPVDVKESKLRLGTMLEGVSMAMPCSDNLSLFCCCCCWGITVSLFNPNVAGLRSGCCCITLLFGLIMFMTETGTGLASTFTVGI